MKIVLTSETFLPKIDGIVSIVCRTLDYLKERGIETMLITPEQGVRDYAGAQIIGAPCITNWKYPEGKIGFPSFNAYHAIRDFKPDLVHLIDPALVGLGALWSAKWLKTPVVASYHLSLSRSVKEYGMPYFEWPVRKWRVWGFNAADHALAPSRNAQRLMQSYGVRRVGWWRRGVDSVSFNPVFRSEEMRKRFGLANPDTVAMIYVGRLAPDKRIDQIKPILESVPNSHLVLVGGGPARNQLEELFKGLPVTFMGYMRGRELATAYASADMFVFPSAHETFGLVLAEAIASGIPAVSTKVGGAEDVIQHGESGYLVDVNDMAGLVKYAAEIASNAELRHAMGNKARIFAETLTWPAMMGELVDFYEDVIAEKGVNPDVKVKASHRPKSPMFQSQAAR